MAQVLGTTDLGNGFVRAAIEHGFSGKIHTYVLHKNNATPRAYHVTIRARILISGHAYGHGERAGWETSGWIGLRDDSTINAALITGDGNGLEGVTLRRDERTSGVEYPAGHSNFLNLQGDFTVPVLTPNYNIYLVGVFGGIEKVPNKILGVSYLDFEINYDSVP